MDIDLYLYVAIGAAIAALALAWWFAIQVNKEPQGNDRMKELAAAIREGAMAFIKAEYTWVAAFVVVMTILIAVFMADEAGVLRAVAYVVGAVFSALAGFIGMRIATAANARTTEAARLGKDENWIDQHAICVAWADKLDDLSRARQLPR